MGAEVDASRCCEPTRRGPCNRLPGHNGSHCVRADLHKVVTDCCGQLLPESQVLIGDTHIPDMCPACQWLDGRAHDQHVTCDWSKGIECPGPDWTYSGDPANPVAPSLTPPADPREQGGER